MQNEIAGGSRIGSSCHAQASKTGDGVDGETGLFEIAQSGLVHGHAAIQCCFGTRQALPPHEGQQRLKAIVDQDRGADRPQIDRIPPGAEEQ